MRILCTGINHKTAPVALRERLAIDPAATGAALADLVERWEDAEFVILSTCNRTEVYAARELHGHPREGELRSWVCSFRGERVEPFEEAIYTLTDASAVRHLLAVASGLDSLIVGEAQISGQVKAAYALAREGGTAGAVMNDLFQTALHVAKHVRSETGLGAGKVSVASVAIDCVMRSPNAPPGKCVLSIGAGKMSQLMLRRLAGLGASRILIANRSAERASELAEQVGGEAVDFASLGEHLVAADVVLASTAADSPIITHRMIDEAQRSRGGRPLLIVDIAVPRDVDPTVGEIDNVSLYNVDDLERVVSAAVNGRHKQRVAAEAIVAGHVAEVLRGLRIRDVAPTIDAMYRYARRIADEELEAAANKLREHDDIEADRRILHRALHRTVRRILHPAVENLRKAATSDAVRAHVASLRKLFELDDE